MKPANFILPLILLAIGADVFARTFWDMISVYVFYLGEATCYSLWVFAFYIRNKYEVSEFQKFAIDTTLLMWIPFCLNAIWRSSRDLQGKKEWIDYALWLVAAIILIVKVWKYKKSLKHRTRGN